MSWFDDLTKGISETTARISGVATQISQVTEKVSGVSQVISGSVSRISSIFHKKEIDPAVPEAKRGCAVGEAYRG